MRQTAAGHGLEYSGRARQVTVEDLLSHDLILAMDQENQADLEYLAERAGIEADIRLMRAYDAQNGGDLDVPDPYYGAHTGFELTYAIVSRAVDGLLASLEQVET